MFNLPFYTPNTYITYVVTHKDCKIYLTNNEFLYDYCTEGFVVVGYKIVHVYLLFMGENV